MKTERTKIAGGWRQPFGWLASYALILQLLLGSFAGAQFSAHAADQNWSFFEICYGKGASDGEVPSGTPAKQASKNFGCAVCANAAVAIDPQAPAIVPVQFSVTAIEWAAERDDYAPRQYFQSQRQRAPPVEA